MTCDSEVGITSKYHLSSEFWFADGNIILLAGHYAFKVHRGLLERHSDIFRSMLSIPQPLKPRSKPDQMQDDHVPLYDCPADVHCLLRALYDGVYFSEALVDDFSFLSSVLRLSSKYFVPIPHRQCLTHLKRCFPTTLAGWDRREAAATDKQSGCYAPRDTMPSPILVVHLARELHLEYILPSAFYDLARYGTSKTVTGTAPLPTLAFHDSGGSTTSGDGSDEMDTDSPPDLSLSNNAHVSPVLVQYSARVRLLPADLTTTFLGRECAQRSLASFLSKYLHTRMPSSACAFLQPAHTGSGDTAHICRDAFYFIHLNTLRAVGGLHSGRDADPLYTLTMMADMLHRTDFSDGERAACALRMCAPCKDAFARDVRRGREALWAALPGWFGLEAWDVLERRAREGEEY
ncbi:hypothetical protein FA95DRAFT_1565270 [Auriscalpium vulgare]|uniref:Uncharacterized protein n=1 Tax=Auriscalpium vulgare TaxID=40419 RepID=A0ACB8RDA4_9AGAM|nr:hypothetical protein FA95DRAFT_1565270 [Auriscalpium vulgare]